MSVLAIDAGTTGVTAVVVTADGAGYDGRDDVAVDLRVDDHTDPCAELARLLDLHEWYLSPPDEADREPLTDDLRAELEEFARREGKPTFAAWVGAENVEMRVGDDWIDRRVLEQARAARTDGQ